MEESVLHVKGASLYYKTIGAGPLLVLIPVGNGTTLFYEPLTSYLSSHFHVLLYDRRGYHRSPAEKPPATNEVFEVHADDAAALIEHVSAPEGGQPEPAFIFTSSASSGIALELLTTRPHLVRMLVLHEPVILSLTPDPFLTKFQDTADLIRRKALENDLSASNAILSSQLHTKAEFRLFKTTHVYAQVAKTLPPKDLLYWFQAEMPAIRDYVPDLEKLQRSPYREKVKQVRGVDYAPYLARAPGLRLEHILRDSAEMVPGGHLGYITHAREFADCLGGFFVRRDGVRL